MHSEAHKEAPAEIRRRILIFSFGIFIFLLTHLLFLGSATGLHYDEAWAANFAHRILTEQGFWPIQAMSPYTSAWSHYVAALFFKVLGTHVWVYRLSGVALVFTGVLLISRALWIWGEKEVALWIPLFCGLPAVLILNHRFGVEVTTFLPFCLGLMIWAIASRRLWIAAIAIILGITSHIIFLGACLGLLAGSILTQRKVHKSLQRLVLVCALLLIPFFWNILTQIPEHDKGTLLFLLLPLTVISTWIELPRVFVQPSKTLLSLCGLVFGFALILFLESNWSALYFMGELRVPWLVGFSLVPFIFLLTRWRKIPSQGRWSWIATLVACGILSVKPTARHQELTLLLFGVGMAFCFTRLAAPIRHRLLVVLLITQLAPFYFNYLSPGIHQLQVDRDFSFLFFHDSSQDSSPKQALAHFFGEQGCGPAQVSSPNPRIEEALQFLALGDWPISAQTCAHPVTIMRTAEVPASEAQQWTPYLTFSYR